MARLMDMLGKPELWQWLGGVGGGMSRAARGQGYDISGANQQLFKSMADRKKGTEFERMLHQLPAGTINAAQHSALEQLEPAMRGPVFAKYMLAQKEQKEPAVWRQQMMENIKAGMDPQMARALATKTLRMTDQGARLDMTTGKPPTFGGGGGIETQGLPSAGAPTPRVGPTLWDSLGAAAGFLPAAKHAATDTVGQVFDFASFPETVKARRLFDISIRDLARSLADNPRYPEGMMQDIIRRSGMEVSAWISEDSTRAGLQMMDGFLRDKIMEERRFLERSDISAKERNDGVKAIQAMEGFLRQMGVPSGGGSGAASNPEAGSAPEGVDPDLWQYMTPEEQALWQN